MTDLGHLNQGEARAMIEPISVRIPDAVRITGLSRSRIYQLIASGDIEAAKVGRSTVVLVASLRALILAKRKNPRRAI